MLCYVTSVNFLIYTHVLHLTLCFICSHMRKMSCVIENLYLGDIDDAMKSFDLKQQKGVTHILTVDR